MRTYQAIWDRLKTLPKDQATTKGISITAPAALHPRIVKAVNKEKWLDIGYKILLRAKEDRKAVLIHHRSGSIITFRLRFTLGIKDFTS